MVRRKDRLHTGGASGSVSGVHPEPPDGPERTPWSAAGLRVGTLTRWAGLLVCCPHCVRGRPRRVCGEVDPRDNKFWWHDTMAQSQHYHTCSSSLPPLLLILNRSLVYPLTASQDIQHGI